MMYGVYLYDLLIEKYDTPEEAYESGMFLYEETGEFHEIKMTASRAKTINEMWV